MLINFPPIAIMHMIFLIPSLGIVAHLSRLISIVGSRYKLPGTYLASITTTPNGPSKRPLPHLHPARLSQIHFIHSVEPFIPGHHLASLTRT